LPNISSNHGRPGYAKPRESARAAAEISGIELMHRRIEQLAPLLRGSVTDDPHVAAYIAASARRVRRRGAA
jgi:hypothetical protein